MKTGNEGENTAGSAVRTAITTEDILASMKNRGRFTGSYEEMAKEVALLIKEMPPKLADSPFWLGVKAWSACYAWKNSPYGLVYKAGGHCT